MSKRVAEGQGGAERYGGSDPTDSGMDPPRKATAAQLAKRSIKPLNRRPGAGSRASSPSKASPGPSFNPFGGPDSNSNNNNNNSNQFGQSAPQPPSANSFTFGQSNAAPSSNPFASLSSSQSFPPAPAPSAGSTPSFSFGQSQPAPAAAAAAPSFAPPTSSSFNFAAATSGSSFTFGASPAKPQQNGDSAATAPTPSFSFGSPKPSAPSAPAATPATGGNPFSTSSFDQARVLPISMEEIQEIEAAGPRLSQENKLDELANIVRQSEPKYKDANLAGLNLGALPAAVQRKMLDFVRGKILVSISSGDMSSSSLSASAPAPPPTASGPAYPDAYYLSHRPCVSPFVSIERTKNKRGEVMRINHVEIERVENNKSLPQAWRSKAHTVAKAPPQAVMEDFRQERAQQKRAEAKKGTQAEPETPVSAAGAAQAHAATPDDLDSPMSELDGSPYVLPTWTWTGTRSPGFGSQPASHAAFRPVFHPPVPVVRTHLWCAPWVYGQRSAPTTASWNLSWLPPFSAVSAAHPVNLVGHGQAFTPECDMTEAAQPAEVYVADATDICDIDDDPFSYGQQPMTNNFYPQTPTAEAAKPSFSFGASNAAPTPAFGASSASPSPAFGASTAAPSPAFGTSTAAPSPAFGASSNNSNNTETAAQSSPFKGFGSTAPAQPSPAPAAAPSFSFGTPKGDSQKNQTSAAPAASSFSFGTSTEPSKPSAPSFSFGASNAASPAASSPSKTGSTAAPSFSFGTSTGAQKPADQVSYPKLNQTETNSSDASPFNPTSNNKTSSFESAPSTAPAASPSFGFAPSTAAPTTASPFKSTASAESPKPQSNGFGSSMFSSAPSQEKPAAESSFKGFGASTSTPPVSTPSSSFSFGGAASQPASQSSSQASSSQASSSSALSSQQNGFNALTKPFSAPRAVTPPDTPDALKPIENGMLKMRQLNETFRAQIASADSSDDWSALVEHYLDQVEQLSEESEAAPSVKAIQAAPFSSSSTLGQKRKADEEAAKPDDDKRSKTVAPSTTPQKPLSDTASLFNDILNSSEKPQTPQPTNVFSAGAKTPATAPPAKSNPFAAIARNVSATPGPGPKSAAPSSAGFAPPAASSLKPAASPFQVKPATSTAPTFQLPKFGVGGGASATPNFLSAFGKKAAAEEEKEREKRKAEDMDSDEDEEEWEKRDAEEQAKKKAQLQSASQSLKFTLDSSKKVDAPSSSVFSFGKTSSAPTTRSAPAASTSNIFGHLSGTPAQDEQESDADDDEDVHDALKKASPAKPTAGKSLFDRVEPPSDSEKDKTSAPGTPGTSFKFSSFGSSTSPAGDNTWKENTPIKFGGMSTMTAGTTTPDGSPAKPSAPSIFSSQSTAATPKFDFGGASKTASTSDKPSTPFSGIFGAKKDDTSKPATPATSIFATAEASKSSPSVGFQFGGPGSNTLAPPSATSSLFPSANTSRATTPGATTTDAEGSAAESEPSDTPNDAQKELSALTSAEIADNDLLYEGKCRATKFVKDADPAWQSQGTGPIRLLRAKATGKPRILMRTDPGGKIVLNFNLILNKDMYTIRGGKTVQMMVASTDKKLETVICTFGNAEKVEACKSALHEAIEKTEK